MGRLTTALVMASIPAALRVVGFNGPFAVEFRMERFYVKTNRSPSIHAMGSHSALNSPQKENPPAG
jgi:hypothetical protein